MNGIAVFRGGLAIIFLGIQYQKRKDDIDQWFRRRVLSHIRGFVPPRVLLDL